MEIILEHAATNKKITIMKRCNNASKEKQQYKTPQPENNTARPTTIITLSR